jgi:hypothetical protein
LNTSLSHIGDGFLPAAIYMQQYWLNIQAEKYLSYLDYDMEQSTLLFSGSGFMKLSSWTSILFGQRYIRALCDFISFKPLPSPPSDHKTIAANFI